MQHYPESLRALIRNLSKLPGIGEKTAERIIAYRMRNGGFKEIKELQKIKGINAARYGSIEKYFLIE